MPAKPRILYVDDNEDSRFVIITILELLGYEVSIATTATTGLELARTEAFALLLLDNKLPDYSGLELCRQIRAFDQQTPIVFYSGAAHASDKQLAQSAGAQAFLAKPISAEQLQQTIARLIGRSETE